MFLSSNCFQAHLYHSCDIAYSHVTSNCCVVYFSNLFLAESYVDTDNILHSLVNWPVDLERDVATGFTNKSTFQNYIAYVQPVLTNILGQFSHLNICWYNDVL